MPKNISISSNSVEHTKTVSFQTILWSISTQFKCKYTVYLSKTFLFRVIHFSQTVLIQAIQFRISTQFSSIWPIDRTLSGTTTPRLSGHESDGNEGIPHIPIGPAFLETHDQIVKCHNQDIRWGNLSPLQRCSWCILQPSQPTGPKMIRVKINVVIFIGRLMIKFKF